MSPTHEIERKFLLSATPSLDDPLLRDAEVLVLEQTYLVNDDPRASERVRQVLVERSGERSYYHTLKRDVGGLVRSEEERGVSGPTYRTLLQRRCPERATIRKRRFRFPFDGRCWELDVYERPAGLVILEVELASSDEQPTLPTFADGALDVSLDRRFRASSLARELL